MILKLTSRTLLAHPVRFAVLAGGFGVGVGVMAALLGVGEVILEQALSPGLVGGGDVQVFGPGKVENARYVLEEFLGGTDVESASPLAVGSLYLVEDDGRSVKLSARAGIPSRERSLSDVETAGVAGWKDSALDLAWSNPSPADLLRSLDRFHALPTEVERQASWAEWLYFNGRGPGLNFYLTFLVGPPTRPGHRGAFVRMQVERDGERKAYSSRLEVSSAEVLAGAPELTLGSSRIRLDGMSYLIDVDLKAEDGEALTGQVEIVAEAGKALPPFTLRGARGWQTGYTVPILAGRLNGRLEIGGESVDVEGTGYHDHNWGSWAGVTWHWGQVAGEEVSVLYGRVKPSPDDAAVESMPSVLALLGEDGILGYTMSAEIEEEDDDEGNPIKVSVRGRGEGLDIAMVFLTREIVRNRPGFLESPSVEGPALLQMQGEWTVRGRAGGRELSFTAEGSAETFR